MSRRLNAGTVWRERPAPVSKAASNASHQRCSGRVPTAGGRFCGPRGAVIVRAVVVTDTVAVAALDPFKVTEVGLTVHVASEGPPLHAKLTAPVGPPPGAMV